MERHLPHVSSVFVKILNGVFGEMTPPTYRRMKES